MGYKTAEHQKISLTGLEIYGFAVAYLQVKTLTLIAPSINDLRIINPPSELKNINVSKYLWWISARKTGVNEISTRNRTTAI